MLTGLAIKLTIPDDTNPYTCHGGGGGCNNSQGRERKCCNPEPQPNEAEAFDHIFVGFDAFRQRSSERLSALDLLFL